MLCVIYRSPISSFSNDQKLFEILHFISRFKEEELIIVGDFNFNTINRQIGSAYPVQPRTTLFLDTIQELFLTQIIRKPTKYRKGYKNNILNLVLTNNSYFVYDVDFDNSLDCSDHLRLVIYLNFDITIYNKKRLLYYCSVNYVAVNNYLDSFDWLNMFTGLNVPQSGAPNFGKTWGG